MQCTSGNNANHLLYVHHFWFWKGSTLQHLVIGLWELDIYLYLMQVTMLLCHIDWCFYKHIFWTWLVRTCLYYYVLHHIMFCSTSYKILSSWISCFEGTRTLFPASCSVCLWISTAWLNVQWRYSGPRVSRFPGPRGYHSLGTGATACRD